ncbi:MAG: amidohydrolase [Anaerolineales bacterium]|nr:amidohydrolase [Anaerolineales bacterium]
MLAALIFRNCRVFTSNPAAPTAAAVVVRGNRIVYVGDDAGSHAWQGQEIDGQGHTLMPGFIDSHFHLLWGAKLLSGPQLAGERSLADLRRNIQGWLEKNEEADWIVGQGVSYSIPTPDVTLDRQQLDSIVADRPLVLMAFDHHSMFVNTMALQRAGILHNPPTDLANGEIEVVDGTATGALYESDAMNFIHDILPVPDEAEMREIVRQGLAHVAELGITSVHNMDGDYDQATLYATLEDMGELSLRVYIPFSAKPQHDPGEMLAAATAMAHDFQSEKVRAGAVKFFMDGVYESYTAMTLNGYSDRSDHLGEPIWPATRFAEMAVAADRAGLQIAVHAVGDGAVSAVLDGYAAARRQNGIRDSRHRIEHIEVVNPADLARFQQLGVVASMQPLHAPLTANDPDAWALRVRREDWPHAFAWAAFRQAGIPLAFGSDWPVVTADPLLGLHGAVNRQPFRPGLPQQQQSLTDALASYTRVAAFTEFTEEDKGQIKNGQLADLVLLDADIFAIPPEAIGDVRVNMTICDGQIVYARK